MAKLLRLPEAPADHGADPNLPLIKQADYLRDPSSHALGKAPAVVVAPADKVEDLAPHLAGIAVVAIEFPNPGDGRGYTSARLLRQRYGFQGEIRAVGAGVKQDLLFFMARCGIDAFDLAPTENEAEARQALNRFTLAYQPAVPRSDVREARFTAARP
ncbi:MAG TPA: DUF934 domain-containing protein [Steroidobacteraceae bacterium]|jgi:uncharacterized protein (DUF934 family)|nr:DUF934 domain-containing protein [Steroidobacteraceae bacterium]